MAANKMDEILKHFPDLENVWKEMVEKLKAEPAEREMLSLKYRGMLQRESSKESLVESEFTKVKRADSDLKVMKANEAQKNYPMQFRDKIDEYLWKEHHIIGGCCSSVESLKYTVAREVAEKLTDAFIEKACEYLYNYNQKQVLKHGARATLGCGEYTINVDEFRKYMKGE